MSFGSYISNGLRMLKFDKDAITSVATDESISNYPWIAILIPSLVFSALIAFMTSFVPIPLFSLLPYMKAMGIAFIFVVFFVLYIVFILLSISIMHGFARLFGGTATWKQLFRVYGAWLVPGTAIGIALAILSLIPLLGSLIVLAADIYFICVAVVLIRETYHMTTGRAVLAILALPVLLIVLAIVAALIYFPVISSI